MSIDCNEKTNPNIITSYLGKNTPAVPRKSSSSVLSSVELVQKNKKANNSSCNMEESNLEELTSNTSAEANPDALRKLLLPLMEKVDQLREAVDTKYEKWENAITTQKKEVSKKLHKIEESISTEHTELKASLTNKTEESNKKLEKILDEYASLTKECSSLKDRIE